MRVDVMVAADGFADLAHRRAAELAPPDHQGVLEQAPGFQVLDQGRAGLVDVAADLVEVAGQGLAGDAVVVPVGVVELDEPHAPLDQPAGEQAVAGERRLAGLGAIHSQGLGGLRAQVDQLRGARLHPERHLVGVDPGCDLGVGGGVEPGLVEGGDRLDGPALAVA